MHSCVNGDIGVSELITQRIKGKERTEIMLIWMARPEGHL